MKHKNKSGAGVTERKRVANDGRYAASGCGGPGEILHNLQGTKPRVLSTDNPADCPFAKEFPQNAIQEMKKAKEAAFDKDM